MVRSGADSFLQGGFPYGEGLPRNGEHEIHVDMGHSRIFQHFHGVQSLGRGMFAPQQMQDFSQGSLDDYKMVNDEDLPF